MACGKLGRSGRYHCHLDIRLDKSPLLGGFCIVGCNLPYRLTELGCVAHAEVHSARLACECELAVGKTFGNPLLICVAVIGRPLQRGLHLVAIAIVERAQRTGVYDVVDIIRHLDKFPRLALLAFHSSGDKDAGSVAETALVVEHKTVGYVVLIFMFVCCDCLFNMTNMMQG